MRVRGFLVRGLSQGPSAAVSSDVPPATNRREHSARLCFLGEFRVYRGRRTRPYSWSMARVDAKTVVPYEVQAALVEAAGKAFWYWDDYRHFLRKSGVHSTLVTSLTNSGLSKYQIMRQLL